MEKMRCGDVHAASDVLVAAFDDDPVYKRSYPTHMLRQSTVYAMFAAGIYCMNMRCTRVLKDDAGRIVATAVFEDERRFPLLQLLGFLAQSQLLLLLVMKKAVLYAAARGALHVLALPLTLPLVLVGYNLGNLFFGSNLAIAYCKIYALGRKDGWHKQRKKHLLAIGTLPSEQGKGYGSTLLKAALAELEAEKHYGGYYLESSNPRNVSFYERNGFLSLGAARLSGMVVTLMVRPDLYQPMPPASAA